MALCYTSKNNIPRTFAVVYCMAAEMSDVILEDYKEEQSMASWIRQTLEFIKKNAECVFTLAGVLIYMGARGAAKFLGIGFAPWLLGVALTVVGVLSTLHSEKSRRDKNVALITHAALWMLRRTLAWIAGVAIVCYLANRFLINGGSRPRIEQEQDNKRISVKELPAWLYSVGGIAYGRGNSDDWSAEYINRDNPGDRITITDILSYTEDAVDTNAGYFYTNG